MKRLAAFTLAFIMLAGACAGCRVPGQDNGSKKIVTTIFPEYDWVREILGDNPAGIELTMLLDSGTDLHSYQPTVDDLVSISTCDMFVYVGGESDGWVDDALKDKTNQDMIVIDLLEELGDRVVEEEEVEGMEHEHDHDHEEEEAEYDEHVWLSLRNASSLCESIATGIKAMDPDNASVYDANLAAYKDKLAALDEMYTQAVESGTKDTLVFGDRFPFRYLVDDYGINYYAAFSGCSAESEASFETVVFLAGKADELGVDYILKIESGDGRIAQSIIDNSSNTGRQILTLDSIQQVTSSDVDAGVTYYSIMEKNLETVRQALA
ncbi:MAG: zinc ABC transporter substrate-binding protein [Clostridiales bacterium]|nr:zinc ABC transporter substrate-binding protein [Clostridiales bacterium]